MENGGQWRCVLTGCRLGDTQKFVSDAFNGEFRQDGSWVILLVVSLWIFALGMLQLVSSFAVIMSCISVSVAASTDGY